MASSPPLPIAATSEKLEVDQSVATASGLACKGCGRLNPPDSLFCNQCGQGLEPRQAMLQNGEGSFANRSLVDLWVPTAKNSLLRLRSPLQSTSYFGVGGRIVAVLCAAVSVFALLALITPLVGDPRLALLRRDLSRQPLNVAVLIIMALAAVIILGRTRERGVRLLSQYAALGGVGLAILGEGLLLAQRGWVGALLLAAALLVTWVVAGRELLQPAASDSSISRRYEFPLIAAVIAVGAFMRFYQLGAYPYGIEGDEMKWSYSIVQYMLAGELQVWPASTFFGYAPLSFWYEALVFRLFGANILVARMMVAALSVGATAVFYLLARRMTSVPVALISTFLLGISIVDVSASRLANVESQIKIWTILGPLLAVWAVEAGRPVIFFLCGLSVAAGLLSYDTYHPMSAVVGLYLLIRLVLRFVRRPADLPQLLICGVAFAVGVMPAVPTTLHGMNLRRGAYVGSWQYWQIEMPPTATSLAPLQKFIGTNLQDLLTTLFVRQRWNDYLVNRTGPLLNAALLPFLVIGFAWTVRHLRYRHNGLILLWLALAFFPAALLIGAVWVRVLYPALPVLYLLTGIGIWWTLTTVTMLLRRSWQPGVAMAVVVFLVAVGCGSGYIYFQEVQDFDDRRARRELVEEVAAAIGPDRMLYLAYQPNRGDFIDIERPVSQFVVRGKVGIGNEEKHARQLPYSELMTRILDDGAQPREVRVIADSRKRDLGLDRVAVLDALQRCFTGVQTRTGKFIDVYHIPASALSGPSCTLHGQASLLSPADGAQISPGQPVEFVWTAERGAPRTAKIQVERLNENLVYVEAEAFKGPAWQRDSRFVDGFNGDGFLLDGHRAGRATAEVTVPLGGTYDVWVRTYRRVADDTHVFLETAFGRQEVARPDPAQINRWVWERAGRYNFGAGTVQLAITKDHGTAPHMSIFIDALYLSRDETFVPEQRTLWDTVLDVDDLAPANGRYSWNAVPGPGIYRWRVQTSDGTRLIDSTGRPGIWSPFREFVAGPT